jgi:hypothetical protein
MVSKGQHSSSFRFHVCQALADLVSHFQPSSSAQTFSIMKKVAFKHHSSFRGHTICNIFFSFGKVLNRLSCVLKGGGINCLLEHD